MKICVCSPRGMRFWQVMAAAFEATRTPSHGSAARDCAGWIHSLLPRQKELERGIRPSAYRIRAPDLQGLHETSRIFGVSIWLHVHALSAILPSSALRYPMYAFLSWYLT